MFYFINYVAHVGPNLLSVSYSNENIVMVPNSILVRIISYFRESVRLWWKARKMNSEVGKLGVAECEAGRWRGPRITDSAKHKSTPILHLLDTGM